MTRYTDFARKRTYVEAGLNYREDRSGEEPEQEQEGSSDAHDIPQHAREAESSEPSKKKRKKGSSKHRKGKSDDAQPVTEHEGSQPPPPTNDTEPSDGDQSENVVAENAVDDDGKRKRSRGAIRAERRRIRDAQTRKEDSERRRVKRKDQRTVDTICFACREKGHAARECTKALKPTEEGGEAKRKNVAKSAVGICYRCGSRAHNLSKCQEPVDPQEPLPYASCFVCSGKGHLASTCPQNQSKGVYPDGGCCKLCGEITHLAKDCGIRKKVEVAASSVLGTGSGAGADEDDFHALKRRSAGIDKSEKTEERVRRQAKVMVGAHSGVVKSFATKATVSTTKVVTF
ncbi:hypothetical protein C8Q72DRAFT_840539 [Fomitopsis betulina]|nr:hypothetical protein C8Q72DRAFT_840539 [Fomitopsis betulina]